jgi:excinuclease UvrABC nuclease subunit
MITLAPSSMFLSKFGCPLRHSQIPNQPGVYMIYSLRRLLYVGKAKNMRTRASSHLSLRRTQGKINYTPAQEIPIESVRFRILPCHNPKERDAIEDTLIAELRPPFNLLINGKRQSRNV